MNEAITNLLTEHFWAGIAATTAGHVLQSTLSLDYCEKMSIDYSRVVIQRHSVWQFQDQCNFEIRCEWGQAGLEALLPKADVVIIVDVFSFSTAVDVATARGAVIFPYRWKDDSAVAYAKSLDAHLIDVTRSKERWSLSPASLALVPAGARLVLPSRNGATLSLLTRDVPTLTGCFRNAKAVAKAAQRLGTRVAVIAAGERWDDGSLRPALEDWMGAGAIIQYLNGKRSPEAESAAAAFAHCRGSLSECLRQCSSGRELTERGYEGDIQFASAYNISSNAPILHNLAFTGLTKNENLSD